MPIPRNIKQYLFHNNMSYLHKIHPVAYTAQELAHVEHVSGNEFAKTVVLQADGRTILGVLPGDHVVDLEVMKKRIGCSKLSLATEKEFSDKFPACEPGAMPPFGKLFGLPLYCDSALASRNEIEFNAGTHTDSLRIKYANFVKLENPVVFSFSEKRTGPQALRAA